MYFSKKVYAVTVYNGVWGKAPEAGKFARFFCVEILQSVRLLLVIEKLGEHDVLVASPIILLEDEQLLPLLPLFPRIWSSLKDSAIKNNRVFRLFFKRFCQVFTPSTKQVNGDVLNVEYVLTVVMYNPLVPELFHDLPSK